MSEPSIAAIVPVYNRPTIVIDALNSIAQQSVPPRLLVVIDDGSTDNTAESVQCWAAATRPKFEFRLVRQPNRGAGLARNRGAAEVADCEILAFLDSDDLWPADYLRRMGEALTRHPEIVAASCELESTNYRTGQVSQRSLLHLTENATARIFTHGIPGTPNTVFRASAFNRVGGYPLLPCLEDYLLMLRISLQGAWLYVPGTPVIARRSIHEVRGEEPPLSHRYEERWLIQARMMDHFVRDEWTKGLDLAPVRRRLEQVWYRAGKHLSQRGHRGDAAECFRQAGTLCPYNLRALWYYFRWYYLTVRSGG